MKDNHTTKREAITVRLSKEDKSVIEANASKYGFTNLSEYIRFIGMNLDIKIKVELNT